MKEHPHLFFQVVSSICFLFVGVFPYSSHVLADSALVIGGVACFVLSAALDERRLESRHKLSKQLARSEEENRKIDSNYYHSLKDFLTSFGNSMPGFDVNERVTVYRRESQSFYRVARFSSNNTFIQDGRSFYPDSDAGCIREAWEKREFFVGALPDPETQRAAYLNELMQEQKITAAVADKFVMRSRSIIALRISHPQASTDLGVVVFESLRAGAFKNEDKDRIWRVTADLIGHHMLRFPDPSLPRSKGA